LVGTDALHEAVTFTIILHSWARCVQLKTYNNNTAEHLYSATTALEDIEALVVPAKSVGTGGLRWRLKVSRV